MSLQGIWTSEIFGLFGWENTGILVLEDGRAIGGGNNHYSLGSYTENGNDVEISLTVEFHGTPRTLFGASEKEMVVDLRGRREEGEIEGLVYREDKPDLTLSFRLTRRTDLP